jgi:NAD(P)-dependent dehydrogenase (short-subunit alcohol dehydrogenase family)
MKIEGQTAWVTGGGSVLGGLFETPLMKQLSVAVQQSLAASIPFPPRLGRPDEFAALAAHIVGNFHLNGETIRLDGALRMAPRGVRRQRT